MITPVGNGDSKKRRNKFSYKKPFSMDLQQPKQLSNDARANAFTQRIGKAAPKPR